MSDLVGNPEHSFFCGAAHFTKADRVHVEDK